METLGQNLETHNSHIQIALEMADKQAEVAAKEALVLFFSEISSGHAKLLRKLRRQTEDAAKAVTVSSAVHTNSSEVSSKGQTEERERVSAAEVRRPNGQV